MKITPEKYFKCQNGIVLTSKTDLLKEFKKYSQGISTEVFDFHRKNNKNDFANWLNDIFEEKELAEKIRAVKTPEEARDILKKELNKRKSEITEEEKEAKSDKQEKEYDKNIIEKGEKIIERATKLKQKTNAKLKPPEEKLEEIKDKYEEIYTEISENRRAGKDVFIAALKLRNTKPKILYYEATAEENAYKQVLELFKDVKKELEESINRKEIDLRKEILEKASQQEVE